ncbi:hypothetical protein P389DRAFT_213068 [Cystobasidium minutum MCA 4210]|uniref:uncharacterized protein n=1 Tax=Cystobasidium minutum MCA 4210 TaxID=1397322 RepID=UPI0034CEE2F5|eukprot:jgi/Rhomi1/213068/estExt_Genemark1.C_90014
MRLFRSKKSDKNNATRPDETTSDTETNVTRRHDDDGGAAEAGDLNYAAQQQQQQQPAQDRAQKIGRGMQAVMNRQPRPLTDQEIVQESIGRFCGLTEDWSIVLELSDTLKTSTASCKLAAEAIRKEFKHGAPIAQERAAKLLVILTRNTSDRFKLQIADSKFIKTYRTTLESSKTEPKVKAMLFKALGTIVWENQGDADLLPLMSLYQDVRPASAPRDGLPVEDGDKTFEPGAEFGQRASNSRRSHRRNNFDPAVQVEQLKQRATVARSEASMLNETLAFTSPEDFADYQIVQEFYRKALAWQQFVSEQLPWVQAEAMKDEPTAKGYEEVLDLLLSANGEINDALKLYHDTEQRLERQKREEEEFRLITERSKQEKNRHDQPYDGGVDLLGLGASSSMAPVASSSGSSNASGSGSRAQDDGSTQPRKIIMQTNNPYAGASHPAPPVLPDRYIVDEPEDEAPPTAMPQSVTIGDKNPFGQYMKQREESVDVPVPREPSAKALGKLRRVSGQDTEVEEQNRRLEEQLRQKYAQNYQSDQQH